MLEAVFNVGDLVVPNGTTLTLSRREAEDFGIVTKVHKPYNHPRVKIFYWVLWSRETRTYVHFDHELILLEKGIEKNQDV